MPDWKQEIRIRLAGMRLNPAHEAEVFEELENHLDDRYAELRASGVADQEAARRALAELNGSGLLAVELTKLRPAERRQLVPAGPNTKGNLFADFWRDLRLGARMLRKTPGFAAIVVLTLGVGIGANTTVFTVINTLLLHPLPVEKPSELGAVFSLDTQSAKGAENLLETSYLNFKDYAAQSDVFDQVTAYSAPMALTFLNGKNPERLFAELVTGNYFETLGLHPVAGRFFLPEEDRTPGANPVAVIGHGPWQRRFGGTNGVIGQTIRINDVTFTIIGVAPEGYKGLNAVFGPDVWIPAMMAGQVLPAQMRDWLTDRNALAFRVAGRLKPGVTAARAEANLKTIAARLAKDYPDANRGRDVAVRPMTRTMLMGSGGQGAILGGVVGMAVVGMVLLIACSNVANLLLARATGRRQEIAVRLAMGAGRPRLVRQLLTESMMLGLISGVVGLGFAYAGSRLLWSFRPPEFAQNLIDLQMDGGVLAFALAISLLTGLVFGTAGALQSSRSDLVVALKEETRTAGRSRGRIRFANFLVSGQVALSLLLLILAGLFLRKMQRDYAIDPGFETRRMGLAMVAPGQAGYDRARTEEFYRVARERVSAIPEVQSMSWATNMPFWSSPSRGVFIEGRDRRDESGVLMVVNTVDVEYFGTFGVPILRGRDFRESDSQGNSPVAIVNQTMADRYWPDQNAIGKRFQFAGENGFREIVGIARTANYRELGEEPQPCIFLPLRQNFSDTAVLYVRTAGDPAGVLGSVQREIHGIDERIEAGDVRTIAKVIDQELFGTQMSVGLMGVFGLLALGLASLGLYGVMAYSVNLRQREIGLRMALGAGRASVLRLILREGLTLTAIGVVFGIAASIAAGAGLSRMMFGMTAVDPLTLAGASVVLLLVAAVACAVPAYRASGLDPLAALRET